MACITLPDGTRTQKSTGTTDRELAQKIADEWEQTAREAKRGKFNEARYRHVTNDILRRANQDTIHSDTVEVYLRDWLKSKENEGTKARYTHMVDLFLAHLGQKGQSYLDSISHKDILEFIKTRQGLAPRTILIDIQSLNIPFSLAKRLHFIQDNPVEKALAINPISRAKSMVKAPFTLKQVTSILQAAKGEWRTVILFGFYTGARFTDCARMQWDNVKLTDKLVDYVARKTDNRTEDEHILVPLAPQLEAHLLELPSSDNIKAYITPELATKKTRGRNGLSESFKRIMVSAGVDPQEVKGKGKRKFSRLSFHSLRHTCNSLLAEAGVDQETRMKAIGWKSKDINDGYTHLSSKIRDAMNKLPSIIPSKP